MDGYRGRGAPLSPDHLSQANGKLEFKETKTDRPRAKIPEETLAKLGGHRARMSSARSSALTTTILD